MGESMSPFDIASHINDKKGVLDVEEIGYNAYVINKVLSNTADSVLFANEMNRHWGLTNQQQFDFYYHGLPKKKRFGKWHKNQDDTESLNLIQEYYGYSRKRAKDVLSLLRPYLDDIRKELEKGGRNVAKQKAGTT
jgi:hypothetical protein